jgi:hypothetical protein
MLILISMNQNCVSGVAANGDGISCLAFQLWEEAGCPEGRYLEFWMGAETRLLAPQRPGAIKAATVAAKPSSGKTESTPIRHDNRCSAHLIL